MNSSLSKFVVLAALAVVVFACGKSNDGGSGAPAPIPPYCNTYTGGAVDPRCTNLAGATRTRGQFSIVNRDAYNKMLMMFPGIGEVESSPFIFIPETPQFQQLQCIPSGATFCEQECNNYTQSGGGELFIDISSGNTFGSLSLKTGPYVTPTNWASYVGFGCPFHPERMYSTINFPQIQYQPSNDAQGHQFLISTYGQGGSITIMGYQQFSNPNVQVDILFQNTLIATGMLTHY